MAYALFYLACLPMPDKILIKTAVIAQFFTNLRRQSANSVSNRSATSRSERHTA